MISCSQEICKEAAIAGFPTIQYFPPNITRFFSSYICQNTIQLVDLFTNDPIFHLVCFLSSPRAKRAGPKGLRAESARAVTDRRCPHGGEGELFEAPTRTESQKWLPIWEMNGVSEGYERAIDQKKLLKEKSICGKKTLFG